MYYRNKEINIIYVDDRLQFYLASKFTDSDSDLND